MNKGLSIALLVIGVMLVIWGVSASESFSSNVAETVSGAPSNKTIWLLIGGVASGLVGFFGLLSGRRA